MSHMGSSSKAVQKVYTTNSIMEQCVDFNGFFGAIFWQWVQVASCVVPRSVSQLVIAHILGTRMMYNVLNKL